MFLPSVPGRTPAFCVAVAMTLAVTLLLGGHSDAVAAGGGPSAPVVEPIAATVKQRVRRLQLTVRAREPITDEALGRSSVCIYVARTRSGPFRQRICFAGRRAPRLTIATRRQGEWLDPSPVSAEARVAGRRALEATARFDLLGLEPGAFRWVARSTSRACRRMNEESVCAEVPEQGAREDLEVRPVAIRGCRARRGSLRSHGPRGRRAIALTFDDGPAQLTGQIAQALERHGARGTFFSLGQYVRGRASTLRGLAKAGHELANHSYDHKAFPSLGSLTRTSALIRSASGFAPCHFRPPYGSVNGALIARAGAARMETITWDVDPRDWAGASSSSIAAHILRNAHPGAIVVLHDGPVPRGQTLAAVKRVVPALKRRGYRVVTVANLLREGMIWDYAD